MKYLLLVVIAVAVFATVDSHPLERHARSAEGDEPEQCLLEYTPQKLQDLRQVTGKIDEHPVEVKELVLCFLKTIQVFSEKSGFNADNFVVAFAIEDKVKGREIVVKCADKNEQKSTPVEWAYRGMECLKDSNIDALVDRELVKKRLTDFFKQ